MEQQQATQMTPEAACCIGMGQIYDVRSSAWLNKTNDIAFISPHYDRTRAIALTNGGSLKVFSKASKVLKAAGEIAAQNASDVTDVLAHPSGGQMVDLAASVSFFKALNANNVALYKSIAEQGEFAITHLNGKERQELVLKAPAKMLLSPKRLGGFPHQKRGEDDWEKTVHEYLSSTPTVALMQADRYRQWERERQSAIDESGYDQEEYEGANEHINRSILLAAAAMGKRAVPHPFRLLNGDNRGGKASIEVGRFLIEVEINYGDMVDVRVIEGKSGKTVGEVCDLSGLTTKFGFEGAVLSYSYNHIYLAAYALWSKAKAGK